MNKVQQGNRPGLSLPRNFYTGDDVVSIAKELLGKVLYTRFDRVTCSGIICETEAYAGINDKASHAYGGRRTSRTEVMYAIGGTAYVYLCYGIHSLFNVVTNMENVPHAVLIRGIVPLEGIGAMLHRTGKTNTDKQFGIGPGKVSKAMGIHFKHTGMDLTDNESYTGIEAIWIEDHHLSVENETICAAPRIGVEYAGEDSRLPYRFYFKPDILTFKK